MVANVRPLGGRRFRTHPAVRPVAVDDLSPAGRSALHALGLGDGIYGVLESGDPGRGTVAIDYDTALLCLALTEAGPVPERVGRLPARERDETLARLVCDRVLQVERADGTFVDGVGAYAELFDAPPRKRPRQGRVAELSDTALRYAVGLRGAGHGALVRKLYAFNSAPRTPALDAAIPDREAAARRLGLDDPALAQAVEEAYRPVSAGPDDPWLRWTRRGPGTAGGCAYKVYVSPALADLPAAFAAVVAVCAELAVPAIKVGGDLAGLLRPDKLLVYVDTLDDLHAVTRALRPRLAGCRPQGVPFTGALDSEGLLSWGGDPEPGPATGLPGAVSWRMLVVDRLARALAACPPEVPAADAVAASLARLRLDAVDTENWCPAESWERR